MNTGKIRLLVLVAGVAAAVSFAASGSPGPSIYLKNVVTGTPHQALMAIAFDKTTGVAVGAAGEIENSTDGGATWKADPSPTPLSLLGVDIHNDLSIAVGQMGLVVVRDRGTQWVKKDTGTTERLLNVSINSEGNAVAVGSFGTVLESTDRGGTWNSIAPEWGSLMKDQGDQFMPHMYAAHIDDAGTITVAGELGCILQSRDGGKSWAVVHHGDSASHNEEESLFSMDFRSDGVAFAVGQNGRILRSANGGATWQVSDSNVRSNLLSIHSSANGEIVVTGMYSMLVSNNDGKTWNTVRDQEIGSGWYAGVARSAGGANYAVGKAGSILKVNF
ncbi:MAG: hypothetical protein OSA97_02905 [Nevskia sp.]|nr:hypothetical protein [Nevskia sp.]